MGCTKIANLGPVIALKHSRCGIFIWENILVYRVYPRGIFHTLGYDRSRKIGITTSLELSLSVCLLFFKKKIYSKTTNCRTFKLYTHIFESERGMGLVAMKNCHGPYLPPAIACVIKCYFSILFFVISLTVSSLMLWFICAFSSQLKLVVIEKQ